VDRKTASEYAYAADRRGLWRRLSQPAYEPTSLTPGEALIVITLLSLGLWAGIWAAIATAASALF
jgi:hypothetical protein